jgi:hypothetical protein
MALKCPFYLLVEGNSNYTLFELKNKQRRRFLPDPQQNQSDMRRVFFLAADILSS